jgi:hypothetical protein
MWPIGAGQLQSTHHKKNKNVSGIVAVAGGNRNYSVSRQSLTNISEMPRTTLIINSLYKVLQQFFV